MKNARIVIAIITSLLDEALIVAFIIFGLPRLGVHIPLWGTIFIGTAFLVYAVTFYILGSTVLRWKPMPGFSSMIGTEGRVVTRLAPVGFIRIKGELWQAKATRGIIDTGKIVIVVDQNGLNLVVGEK
jgi:membrane-bound ClpP family serine protease